MWGELWGRVLPPSSCPAPAIGVGAAFSQPYLVSPAPWPPTVTGWSRVALGERMVLGGSWGSGIWVEVLVVLGHLHTCRQVPAAPPRQASQADPAGRDRSFHHSAHVLAVLGGWAGQTPRGGSRLSTWECIPGVCILLFAPLPGCQPALSNACPPPSVPAGDLGLNFMPSRGGSSSDAPAPCSHPWCPPPGLSNHPNPPHISRESLRDVHHPRVPQAAPRTPTPPWALTFGPREPGSPSGPGFPWGPFIFKGNVQGGGGCNETSPTEALLVLLCSAVSGANPACPGSSHQHRRTVTMQGDKTRGVLLLGCPPNLGECPPRGARPAAGAALAAGRVLVSTPATWAKAGGCSPSPCTSNSHPGRWRWSKRFGPLWSPGPCPPGGKGVPRAALPHKDHLWLGKAAESSMQTESLGRLSCSSLFAAVSAAEDIFFFLMLFSTKRFRPHR